MKGSISEFELGVLRACMLDAARAKARRGELRIGVPVGCIWHREVGLGFDPDRRIQEVIRLVFARFRELGSAHQAIRDVAPSALSCEQCLKIGSLWVHLRLCRTCGHVGCCGDLPNRHATRHFHATGHPVIEGYDPPEFTP